MTRYTGLIDHVKHPSGRMKTVCTSAVLGFFGIHESTYHYGGHRHEFNGILNRNGWSARSRNSATIRKGKETMGKVRAAIRELREGEGVWFAVRVRGHILLLDHRGETVVDTAPRKIDRRRVLKVDRITRIS